MSNFLKDYLKKMFHGADPLDYIQDVCVDATPEGQECIVRVKVPKPIKPEEKKLDPMDAVNALKPERILYSGPKTIVFWPDGTKTIVSRMEGQEHDEYGAFCAAVVKKMFGTTHKAQKFLDTIKVNPEPKVKKKDKYEQMEMTLMSSTGEDSSNV